MTSYIISTRPRSDQAMDAWDYTCSYWDESGQDLFVVGVKFAMYSLEVKKLSLLLSRKLKLLIALLFFCASSQNASFQIL